MKIYYPKFKNSYQNLLKKFYTNSGNPLSNSMRYLLIEDNPAKFDYLIDHLIHYEKYISMFYNIFDETKKEVQIYKHTNDFFKETYLNLISSKKIFEANQYYLGYFIKEYDCFQILTIWKIEKCLSSLIRCVNLSELLPAVMLSRNILENMCLLIRGYNELSRLDTMFKKTKLDLDKNLVNVNKEFEEHIFKYLHSSKLEILIGLNEEHRKNKEPENINYVQSTNILTHFKRLEEILEKQNKLVFSFTKVYNILSDICHNSSLSNIIFVESSEINKKTTYKYNKKNDNEIFLFIIICSISMSLGYLNSNLTINFKNFRKTIYEKLKL